MMLWTIPGNSLRLTLINGKFSKFVRFIQ
jgi:hypothetical protein